MTRHPHLARSGARNGAAKRPPTPYADLNRLLDEWATGVRTALGDNFVGAYLQGSFALGDFDEQSDVDFLVVIGGDLTEVEHDALQALHTRLHEAANPWATRLEGSYFPKAILRRWSQTPRDPPGAPPRPADWADPGTSGRPPRVYPLLFKGNGERDLVRSEHDNTQVVRWVARESGIALAGPPPRTLIEPVSGSALRAEVAPLLKEVAGWRTDPTRIDARWLQAFSVLLACRMLHTLETGRVTSKKAAADWARGAFDVRWAPLIGDAQAAREENLAQRFAPPMAEVLAETLAFLAYAEARGEAAQAPKTSDRTQDFLARASAAKTHGPKGPSRDGPGFPGGRDNTRRQFAPPPTRPGGRGRRG
jgi:hypothetical protein